MLLSITKNCETLIEQTRRIAEQTLEVKTTKTKETFHFKPSIPIEGSWMIGLTNLEVYNSIFNITKENNKFELYKFPDEKAGGFSNTIVRDEIEKDLVIEDITAAELQDETIGPIINEGYKEQITKRMKNEQYMNNLSFYTRSVFQDFESFLRTQIDLVEDDIKLVLDEYIASFITYENPPDIYTFKDISEVLLNCLQSEFKGKINEIDIEYDDITMKIKLIVGVGILAVKLEELSFFSNNLGFTPGWDYKHYNKYISQEILNIGSTNKIKLKCDIIDGSVVNGLRQPILYSFVLDELPGNKVFCEPETIHYKKQIKVFWILYNFI